MAWCFPGCSKTFRDLQAAGGEGRCPTRLTRLRQSGSILAARHGLPSVPPAPQFAKAGIRKQRIIGFRDHVKSVVARVLFTASGKLVDDETHVVAWDLMGQLVGGPDFLYLAGCKLASDENLGHIARRGGRFVKVMPRTHRENQEFSLLNCFDDMRHADCRHCARSAPMSRAC